MGGQKIEQNQTLTLREASKISGYTSDHLARLVRTKKINGTRIARNWLISRGDLEKYLATQRANSVQRDGDTITLKEASLLSGYTSDHLARLIRTRRVKGIRIGRTWLITRSDFEKYIHGQNISRRRKIVLRKDIIRLEKIAGIKKDLRSRKRRVQKIISAKIEIYATPAMQRIREYARIAAGESAKGLSFTKRLIEKFVGFRFHLPHLPAPKLRFKFPARQFNLSLLPFKKWRMPAAMAFAIFMIIFTGALIADGKMSRMSRAIGDLKDMVFARSYSVEMTLTENDLSGSVLSVLTAPFDKIATRYRELDDRLSDFLGDQYIKIVKHAVPGFSPFGEYGLTIEGAERILGDLRDLEVKIRGVGVVEKIVIREVTEVTSRERRVARLVPIKEVTKELIREVEKIESSDLLTIQGDIERLKRDLATLGRGLTPTGQRAADDRIENIENFIVNNVINNNISLPSNILAETLGLYTSAGEIALIVNQRSVNDIVQFWDNDTLVFSVADGGIASFNSATTSFNGVAYGWPSALGSADQVLTTDATGNLSWGESSSVAGQWTDAGTFLHPGDSSGAEDVVVGGSTLAAAHIFFGGASGALQGSSVFNEQGVSTGDFRIEGDTLPQLFFTDASSDRVGIGTSSPDSILDIQANLIGEGGRGAQCRPHYKQRLNHSIRSIHRFSNCLNNTLASWCRR